MSTLQILLSGTSRVPNKYYYQVPHEYLTNTTIRYLISTLQILLSGTSWVPYKYYYQVPHEYLINTTIRYLTSTLQILLSGTSRVPYKYYYRVPHKYICVWINLYIIYKIYLRLESSVWVYNNFHSFVIIYQNNDEIKRLQYTSILFDEGNFLGDY